jgi:hypothetical protein
MNIDRRCGVGDCSMEEEMSTRYQSRDGDLIYIMHSFMAIKKSRIPSLPNPFGGSIRNRKLFDMQNRSEIGKIMNKERKQGKEAPGQRAYAPD